MDVILQNKHAKRMLPLAIAITIVGCSSSSNDELEVQEDTTTDADVTPDTEVTPETNPNESALNSASRIDLARYERLIENVSPVGNAGSLPGTTSRWLLRPLRSPMKHRLCLIKWTSFPCLGYK